MDDLETKITKETPYELLKDDENKNHGKNNEAKMTLYIALPRKEYERVFMCKTRKEIWHTLIITRQGNSQVKDCMIDLLTQQYKKFSISSEETIDSGFTRAKVTTIKEAKDMDTFPLDELIRNLKFYEMVLENDGIVSKTTKEKVKSLTLKAKVTRDQTSDDSDSQGGSDEDEDEAEVKEFNLMARNFRKEEGHFIGNCPKLKGNKAFVGGAWSDSEEGYSQTSKAYIVLNKETMKIEESLNVTFHVSLPKPKSSPSIEYDRINEPIVQDLNGERMVLPDNPMGYPDNVLDNQIFITSINDSHASSVEMYLNEEENDGDSMVIPQTLSEKIRTRIDNTRDENRVMFMSINEAIKVMLAVATNMSCVVENNIGKEGSKDNFKEKDA
ncbi:hypothetical protein Tco_0403463 [Tanacetum coccineum]